MKHRGFSLVELIVVVGIFITISAVVLFNQNRFSSNIGIQNLAYQIALAIRQSQVYGISVRGSEPNSSASYDTAYGVQFNCQQTGSFILFADENKDGKYTVADDTQVSQFKLDNGSSIANVTTYDNLSNSFSCADYPNLVVDITFKRPNSEALIVDNLAPDLRRQAVIDIVSNLKDKHEKIFITLTGQIYVQS